MKNKAKWIVVSITVGVVALLTGAVVTAGALSQESQPQGRTIGHTIGAGVAASTPVGTAFTYQGQLKKNGNPVNGPCDFQFGLYDAGSEGNQVGITQTLTITVTDGLFTANLDFGNVFTGTARWLGIAVKCGSESSYTSLGRQELTPVPYALALPGLWTQQNTTSSNVIGGHFSNTVASGVVGAVIDGGGRAGKPNQVSANYATVGGGGGNTGSGDYATVGGGSYNTASDNRATVGGGGGNTASGIYATVGGGGGNEITATAFYATIGGGSSNMATAAAQYATVGGGSGNAASAVHATIGGGSGNAASGSSATVGGGSGNAASSGYTTVGGGRLNHATAPTATIGGGEYISVTGSAAAVSGGSHNTASGDYSTVGGGYLNTADSYEATVAGGANNHAGYRSTVGGGLSNTASKKYATVPGGESNSAAGDFSLAAGHRAKANHTGAFVWADSTSADFASERQDQFRVRANGGARFDVNDSEWVNIYDDGTDLITTSVNAHLTAGGVWANSSDHNAKENFALVDEQDVLARLAELPITTWNYLAEDPSVRHMGPTAQDFYAAFGLGGSDTSIGTVDADGVALAAIQALHVQNQELAAENAAQQAQIDGLEARLAALEQGSTSSVAQPSSLWLLLTGLAVLAGVVVQRRWILGAGR